MRDGTKCHCEIYQDGVAEEAIGATVRRTERLRSAPRFMFLASSSGAAVTEESDPRLRSTDLKEVRAAMWDLVAAEAESDPVDVPRPAHSERAVKTSIAAVQGSPNVAALGAGARPWWCKLFRSAPGC